MKIFEILMIILSIVLLAGIIYYISGIKRPILYIFTDFAITAVLIGIINLTTFFSGLYIPINKGTVIGCALSGIPGVFGFLAIKYFFGL